MEEYIRELRFDLICFWVLIFKDHFQCGELIPFFSANIPSPHALLCLPFSPPHASSLPIPHITPVHLPRSPVSDLIFYCHPLHTFFPLLSVFFCPWEQAGHHNSIVGSICLWDGALMGHLESTLTFFFHKNPFILKNAIKEGGWGWLGCIWEQIWNVPGCFEDGPHC